MAKLFAKHIKLKEAAEMTKKTRMGIGVGTPQRLIDLLENGESPVLFPVLSNANSCQALYLPNILNGS